MFSQSRLWRRTFCPLSARWRYVASIPLTSARRAAFPCRHAESVPEKGAGVRESGKHNTTRSTTILDTGLRYLPSLQCDWFAGYITYHPCEYPGAHFQPLPPHPRFFPRIPAASPAPPPATTPSIQDARNHSDHALTTPRHIPTAIISNISY